MIKLALKIKSRKVCVAVSGGLDSMVALDFLARNHEVHVVHVNHGTAWADKAERFVFDYCHKFAIPASFYHITDVPVAGESLENFWRKQRLAFFEGESNLLECPIITGHHLDDAVETWVWSSLHGNPKLPSLEYEDFLLRPFLATPKEELLKWAERHSVPWLDDPSNRDTSFIRNHIRHNLLPMAYKVNPGLKKTIAKKVKMLNI